MKKTKAANAGGGNLWLLLGVLLLAVVAVGIFVVKSKGKGRAPLRTKLSR